MSAQAGSLYFDRRPVPPQAAQEVASRLRPMGPDAGGLYREPGLFMVHRALHVTPEDRLERQPLDTNDSVVTWDGRLDNRTDLLLQFDTRPSTTDVELVARAYRKWGLDAFSRLIGEWSCAIWDRSSRELHLASDYMGARELYWQKSADAFRWSTTLETFPREQLSFNDDYIIGYLMVSGTPPDHTPYKDVWSLSTGHVLSCAADGRITKRPFYQFPQTRLEYRDRRDYEVRFRELLADAVASRMRASAPVWAELSGGFDSSSIVCMAHALMNQGRVSVPDLHVVSHISDQSPESNEEPFIDAVLLATGLAAWKINESEFEANVTADPAYPRNRGQLVCAVCDGMRAAGARVLLSGRLGDDTAGNIRENFPAILEPLAQGHILAGLAAARAWSLASRKPVIEVLWSAGKALLGGPRNSDEVLRKTIRAFGGPHGIDDAREVFSLARLPGTVIADGRASYERMAARNGPPWKRDLLSGFCRMAMRRSLTSWTPDPTVHYSYPFTDRRLVEFILTIPSNELVPPGQPRGLMRRALDGLLPPRILRRFSKGYAAPELSRVFRPTAAVLLESVDTLQLVRLGYLDAAKLRERLRTFLAGANRRGNLWHIALLEHWLTVEGRTQPHALGHEDRVPAAAST